MIKLHVANISTILEPSTSHTATAAFSEFLGSAALRTFAFGDANHSQPWAEGSF